MRRPRGDSLIVDGTDVVAEVHEVLDSVFAFADRVRSGAWVGAVSYTHLNVSAEAFAAARLALVGEFAARESLFSSGAGERLWAEQARTNLRDEARRWSALLDPSRPQAPDPSSRAL